MALIVKQREYIENFLKFVGSFLVTEDATIDEINLVEQNLDLLKARIGTAKETVIKAAINKKEAHE